MEQAAYAAEAEASAPYDTVDSAGVRKSSILTLSSRPSPLKPGKTRTDRSQGTADAAGVDWSDGRRSSCTESGKSWGNSGENDVPDYARSPMAIAFTSAVDQGELRLSTPGESGDGPVETPTSKPRGSSPFKPNPGPVYIPSSASERYPPVKSTQLKGDHTPSPSPTNPFMYQRRRSGSYVDSAAKYSPSPIRGSPSPVKDKVALLEQKRRSPVRESRTSPSPESAGKVRDLVALYDSGGASPAPRKKHLLLDVSKAQQNDSGTFESMLNLQVSSPVVLQRSVSVVEVQSPVNVLKPPSFELEDDSEVLKEDKLFESVQSEKTNGSKVSDSPEFSVDGGSAERSLPESLKALDFNDSAVEEDEDLDEARKPVEEELIVKKTADEVDRSLVGSSFDRSADSTFDERQVSAGESAPPEYNIVEPESITNNELVLDIEGDDENSEARDGKNKATTAS